MVACSLTCLGRWLVGLLTCYELSRDDFVISVRGQMRTSPKHKVLIFPQSFRGYLEESGATTQQNRQTHIYIYICIYICYILKATASAADLWD